MPLVLAYLTVILIWSTTPLAIQWSSIGGGFSFAVLARMLIGLLVSLTILAVARIGFPLHARARRSYLASGLGTFGAMFLTYWGAQYLHSGLISVLFGLTPLMTGVLAALWLGEQSLGAGKIAGIVLGVAGLGVIFAPGDGATHGTALPGLAALLGAVLIYSASMVWVKRIGDDSPPLATTAGSLAVAVPLFALTWALGEGPPLSAVAPQAWLAIVYLGVVGSVLGFALYYYLIKHLEAAKVALITLITPVMALLMGHALNNEAIDARVWWGAGVIMLGLALHQWTAVAPLLLRARR
ncbi:DMT family transporter [Azoarcus olearius]|uniref:Conserved hypothetical membrane protein n=1 Tax=Azoarcus sp. (strain BH72) TaxID=418699 RepID=A1K8L3_AZOSB|nr:DMT family transporter [Azoarcus olearius]CAL95168.1 conserved hypothetical membrane protein [Azoarcus olearius]